MNDVTAAPVALTPALRGTLISVPQPQMAVVINAATGVPAKFYYPFAQWLAVERDAAVLCWDYRDFGASGQPGGSRATMTDWAIHDAAAARDWLRAHFPELPLWMIGHSLGGMSAGFQPGMDCVDRVITVAAGHGHLSAHPWPFRAYAALLWYVAGPLSCLRRDHFPAARFGLGQSLPKGVFRQWRRWLLSRGSLPADPALGGLAQPGYSGPLTLVAMADDIMMPAPCVEKMAAWFPRAQVEHRLLRPADAGLESLGHVRVFSPRNAAIWPALIA
ncbi:alpha/beta hydrolase family protein [Pararhodobacter zhoushanensis]|uniref:Alpha/beta hydrolase n=1 Tax=Pararhodobacter zhoushanensis TaxID=2479545 RepID=A0ABT3GW96_9RHOB|nr:alpha/beta fold hydrolase [Pararhodobacter zhoushanensis]MCW1931805.1 alpha/beta hydrolase [Pararhodobacter zhoushanensis]